MPPEFAAATAPREATLLGEDGLAVTGAHLIARGRVYPLAEILAVTTEQRRPRMWLRVGMAVAGALLTLVAIVATAHAENDVGLVIAPSLLFFVGAWSVLTAEESYLLILETRQGEAEVFRSTEHQLVLRYVAVVDEAVRNHRIRRASDPG